MKGEHLNKATNAFGDVAGARRRCVPAPCSKPSVHMTNVTPMVCGLCYNVQIVSKWLVILFFTSEGEMQSPLVCFCKCEQWRTRIKQLEPGRLCAQIEPTVQRKQFSAAREQATLKPLNVRALALFLTFIWT